MGFSQSQDSQKGLGKTVHQGADADAKADRYIVDSGAGNEAGHHNAVIVVDALHHAMDDTGGDDKDDTLKQ